MEKQEIDQLYHLLRKVSNEGDINLSSTIYGIAKHLLAGGDYLSLIQFSAFYGEKYLVQPVVDAIAKKGWKPSRVVELGSGLSWLGRGLASRLGYLPTLFVDKRQWTMIDLVADLETDYGISALITALKEGDLIVMADLLHCLDMPEYLLEKLSKWPLVVLEYMAVRFDYSKSYITQITRYGCKAVSQTPTLFRESTTTVNLDPYVLFLVPAEVRQEKEVSER